MAPPRSASAQVRMASGEIQRIARSFVNEALMEQRAMDTRSDVALAPTIRKVRQADLVDCSIYLPRNTFIRLHNCIHRAKHFMHDSPDRSCNGETFTAWKRFRAAMPRGLYLNYLITASSDHALVQDPSVP